MSHKDSCYILCLNDTMYLLTFQIHLPTGSYLEVAFGHIGGVNTLELFMNPSSFDTSSMGLCGRVGTKILYSSQMIDVSHNHPEFVSSWKYVDNITIKLYFSTWQVRN